MFGFLSFFSRGVDSKLSASFKYDTGANFKRQIAYLISLSQKLNVELLVGVKGHMSKFTIG